MANTKISNLTALAEAPATGDLLAIVDVSASQTKRITVENLIDAIEANANVFTGGNVFNTTTYADTLLGRRTAGGGGAAIVVAARFVAKPIADGSASDGYGPAIEFDLDDAETTGGPLATVGAIRDGADNSGAFVVQTVTLGTYTDRLIIKNNGNVLIGTTTDQGQLTVDQSSTTAAEPVLVLDQADLSEEFINFISTIGAGNPIDTAALGAYYGKVRVAVNGTFKWLALYD